MTDRRVGGEGLNVDINAQPDRRLAAEGLNVDVVPPMAMERQTDSLLLNVEYVPPTGDVFSALGVSVDLVPTAQRRLGGVGLMVDYVLSAVTYVTWNTPAFQLGGGYPEALWAGTQFAFASGSNVVWSATNERFELG